MTEQSLSPTPDERLLASISHFFGFLVALLLWAFQKDKSRYVRFQASQAMAFDLLVSIVIFLIVGCLISAVIGILVLGVGDIAVFGDQNNPTAEPVRGLISALQVFPFLVACLVFPLTSAIFIVRLIATIQTYRGRDFRYPWLGDWIERSWHSD